MFSGYLVSKLSQSHGVTSNQDIAYLPTISPLKTAWLSLARLACRMFGKYLLAQIIKFSDSHPRSISGLGDERFQGGLADHQRPDVIYRVPQSSLQASATSLPLYFSWVVPSFFPT